MYSVSVTFIQLFPDCLQDSDDIAYVPALILYTHVDNTSLISAYSIQNGDYGLITER